MVLDYSEKFFFLFLKEKVSSKGETKLEKQDVFQTGLAEVF